MIGSSTTLLILSGLNCVYFADNEKNHFSQFTKSQFTPAKKPAKKPVIFSV